MIAFPYQLEIPNQGVSLTFETAADLRNFLKAEASFFAELKTLLEPTVHFANTNFGNLQITNAANRAFSQMLAEIKSDKFQAYENYVASANGLRILIGQGRLGQRVKLLSKSDDASSQQQARWMTYILCAEWADNNSADAQILAPFRAAFAASPITLAYGDLNSSAEAMRQASLAAKAAETGKAELEEFIRQKTEVFDRLEQLYRTKLTLEEPALTWMKIAAQKTKVWAWWLGVFAALVVIPLLLAAARWSTIVDAVGKVTAGANGTFSIAGLAVITIPALLYAWLLKNVSRIFIQNLNLADDAAHRRSLALTYMGLLQDQKHAASDQDRAIILNALFRPIPPQTADEGPPAGVIDLIRNK